VAEGWPGLIVREDGQTAFACPKPNCYYRVLLRKPSDQQHKCPHIGPTTIGWSVTQTLVQKLWGLMDDAMGEFKAVDAEDIPDPATLEHHKGRLTGLADSLAIFMVPHFDSREGILKEANRRWKAKQRGDAYETPGLNSLRYQPPPGTPNKYTPTPTRGAVRKVEHHFSAE
jgi:hypothetical protein